MSPDSPAAAAPATDPAALATVVYCPECSLPAWVEWRDDVASTSGPVELVKLRCFGRHWFLMPASDLRWGVDAG